MTEGRGSVEVHLFIIPFATIRGSYAIQIDLDLWFRLNHLMTVVLDSW